MFNKVLANTLLQIIGKATTATTTLILTIIIGRALGPAGYGNFTKIFVYVGYFYVLADFGLNAVYIKLTQKDKNQLLINYLIGLRLTMAIFLALAASIIALFLPYDPNTGLGFSPLIKIGIILASATIVTQALIVSANAIFQKKLRYDLATITYIGSSIAILTTIIATAAFKLGLIFFVLAYVLQGLAFVIIARFLIKKFLSLSPSPHFSNSQFTKLLKTSAPIGVALVFNIIYFRVDVLILTYTRPVAEVGLYGLAYQFFEVALTVPFFFVNSLFPHLVRLYAAKRDNFAKEVRLWIARLIVFSLATTILLYIASFLIPLIYDARFAPSASALKILALSMPFFFLSALLWHILIIQNKQKYFVYIYLAGAFFNVVVNLIFIPTYGFMAAAVSTVVSEFVVMALLAISLLK